MEHHQEPSFLEAIFFCGDRKPDRTHVWGLALVYVHGNFSSAYSTIQ